MRTYSVDGCDKCDKCDECDEIFYTGDVVKNIEKITERVKQFVQEVIVLDYEKKA